MSTSSYSHSFDISEISYRGTSVPRSVNNELDLHGVLLGVTRLPEERNLEYKKRLLDVYVNRANSTYTGLVNGLTRELGLEFFSPIQITITQISSSDIPRIEISESVIRLWSSIQNAEPDLEINRSDSTKPEYFIGGLVDLINTSANFTATLLSETFRHKRSDCILNQSSSKFVSSQQLYSSKINVLSQQNIERGSVSFSNNQTYREEVSALNLVLIPGQYFMDYSAGVVHSFNVPEGAIFIKYSYGEYDFEPKASPVIIRSVHDEDFKQVLFNKTQDTTGNVSYRGTTDKGASIINELLSVVPTYWGE